MNMNTQRGFAAIIAVIIGVIIIGGGVWYLSFSNEAVIPESDEVMEEEGTMMKEDSDAMMIETDDEMMMEESDDAMMKDEGGAMMSDDILFDGNVLAGSDSPYVEFNKADFDKALVSDKLVVLYFYANWCPTCKAEQPKVFEAFNSLTGDDVVGFRINYNDNQTDANEVALAREHGIGYQHTKVFIKNGEQVLKSPESWNTSRYLSEINKALN